MKKITYGEIRRLHPLPFPMVLVGREAEVVTKAVNMGIDSHLEACNIVGKDSYEWKQEFIAQKLHCSVSADSLPVLLRRLQEDMEYTGEEEDDYEVGTSLVRDILETIGFEGYEDYEFKFVPDELDEEDDEEINMEDPISLTECIENGTHLKSCDRDGFCNRCGEQTSDEEE